MDLNLQLDLSLRLLLGAIVSLGPLNAIAARLHPTGSAVLHIRLEIAGLNVLGGVSGRILAAGAELSRSTAANWARAATRSP